jgi:hypothetical protein
MKKALAIAAILTLVLPASGLSQQSKEANQPPLRKSLRVVDKADHSDPGETIYLHSDGATEIYVGRDFSSYADLMQALRAKDMQGLKTLIDKGDVVAIEDSTSVLLLERHPGLGQPPGYPMEFRILEGDKKDKKFWASSLFLFKMIAAPASLRAGTAEPSKLPAEKKDEIYKDAKSALAKAKGKASQRDISIRKSVEAKELESGLKAVCDKHSIEEKEIEAGAKKSPKSSKSKK